MPRPRAFEAEAVRLRRQERGVYASAAVHRHIRGVDFLRGTRACPVRGCDVADAVLDALDAAVDAHWGTHEGAAVALLEALQRAGHLRWPGVPSKLSAGAAMAMLARSCKLIERTGHGRYRIHACRPSDLPSWILDSLLETRHRDASAPVEEADSCVDVADFDASPPSPKLSAPYAGNRERACGGPDSGPSSASVGDEQGLEPVRPGAAASSSPAPAEKASASPTTPPARAGLEPLVMSRSNWLAALPSGIHIERAAALACRYLVGDGIGGTAAIVAGWLAAHEGTRVTSRGRAALTRAVQTMIRRGLLIEHAGRIRMPELTDPPILAVYDLDPRPTARRPSEAMLAHLRRLGLDASELGHDEAVRLSRRIRCRDPKSAPPRILAAILREHARAALPTDLRRLGRLDLAAARRELESAMRDRMVDEARARVAPWTADAYDAIYG